MTVRFLSQATLIPITFGCPCFDLGSKDGCKTNLKRIIQLGKLIETLSSVRHCERCISKLSGTETALD
jgi:hypothetical protein